MTKLKSSESASASDDRAAPGRLFILELSGNRVFSVNSDGSDRKVIVQECRMPDGIAVDAERGHIYWTNMGVLHLNDGSIERADLAGLNPAGVICEILNDDGTMARVPDLIRFCERHGLVMVTVSDLARYRLESEYERSLWAVDASLVCV